MSVTTTYENIAMIVGIEAAQIIVSEFGGTELYIPHVDNLKNDHKLIGSLGIDTTKTSMSLLAWSSTQCTPQQKSRNSQTQSANHCLGKNLVNVPIALQLSLPYTCEPSAKSSKKISEIEPMRCMLEVSLGCLIN